MTQVPCRDCSAESLRWLDTRPQDLLPAFGIVHGSGTRYDTAPAAIANRRGARYERWRQIVRDQRSLIRQACAAGCHVIVASAEQEDGR